MVPGTKPIEKPHVAAPRLLIHKYKSCLILVLGLVFLVLLRMEF